MTQDQNGYFPIRIYLCDEDKCMVCNMPQDIPNGKTFKVLKCNVTVTRSNETITRSNDEKIPC